MLKRGKGLVTFLQQTDFVSPGAPRIPLGRAGSGGGQGLLALKTAPLAAQVRPSCLQVASNMVPRASRSQLGSTWPHLGPPGSAKNKKHICFLHVFATSPHCLLRCLRWLKHGPKRAQGGPKEAGRMPRWAQDGPQEGPRWPQDGPRWSPDGVRELKKGKDDRKKAEKRKLPKT